MSKKRALAILRAYRRGDIEPLLALAEALGAHWDKTLSLVAVIAEEHRQ